jgi:DNA-binding YbaB/EbfC family protein
VNIQKLMRQAQEMQSKMQRELAELVVEAAAGGGMVTVKMTGHKQLVGVVIDAEIVAANDPAMLADLVLAAVNEAGRKVDEAMQSRLGALTGGLPGGLPGFG